MISWTAFMSMGGGRVTILPTGVFQADHCFSHLFWPYHNHDEVTVNHSKTYFQLRNLLSCSHSLRLLKAPHISDVDEHILILDFFVSPHPQFMLKFLFLSSRRHATLVYYYRRFVLNAVYYVQNYPMQMEWWVATRKYQASRALSGSSSPLEARNEGQTLH